MDIKGYDKNELFRLLYNHAQPFGLGFLHYDPTNMTIKEAKEIIKEAGNNLYFDYFKGRSMKVNLSGDDVDTFCYNRDSHVTAEELLSRMIKGKIY